MRRISQENYDYYFEPLPNTPFSLGLAIPSEYGNTWIKVGDEVKRNLHMGMNMSDFFVGDNWKVHPEWYGKGGKFTLVFICNEILIFYELI